MHLAVPELPVGAQPGDPAAATTPANDRPGDVADQDDWPLDGCGP